MTVTTSRILAEPNASTTIAARVRLWIDARAVDESAIDRWQSRVSDLADDLRARTGVEVSCAVASRTTGRPFSPELRSALGDALAAEAGSRADELVCFAGHDAGVVGELVPAAMVLVRNPTGVSHSPYEDVSLEDAAVAARVVLRALSAVAAW